MTGDSKDDYHVKDNTFHGRNTKSLFDIKNERHLSSQWMRGFISRQYRSVKHHMRKTSRYTKKKVSKSDVFVKKEKRTIGTEQNLNHYLASKVTHLSSQCLNSFISCQYRSVTHQMNYAR